MKFIETQPILTISEIGDAEKEMGVSFPEEFTTHYLQFNGGYAENDKCVCSDRGQTTVSE